MSIIINGKSYESALHEEAQMKNGFGMYHMTSNPEYYEPQRSSDFELIVSDLDNIENIMTGEPIADAQEILRLSLVTAFVPGYSVDVLEDRRGNSVMQYAGKVTFNSGSFKVRDWIGSNSGDILRSWLHQVYDVNTDKVGLISDYKKSAWIIQYSPDKREVRKWYLYGLWPKSVSTEELSKENNQGMTITADMVYDRAVLVTAD